MCTCPCPASCSRGESPVPPVSRDSSERATKMRPPRAPRPRRGLNFEAGLIFSGAGYATSKDGHPVDIASLRSANPDHWNKAAAIRALTLDAVAAANSGHSGMPMGMADVATVLYEKHLK